jgi:hypothetical protein
MHLGIELTMNLYFYPLMFCYLWFFIKLHKGPKASASAKANRVSRMAFIGAIFGIFIFESVNETNWLFTDMKFYAFKIEEGKFTIDYIKATLSDGHEIILRENRLTRPLEQHTVIWGVRRIQEAPGSSGRLSEALQTWATVVRSNLNLEPGVKINEMAYERHFYPSHIEGFDLNQPTQIETLGHISIR